MAPTTVPATAKKRKRNRITVEHRQALSSQHPGLKQNLLAEWFQEKFKYPLSPASISESLSDKFKELDDPTKAFKSSSTRLKKTGQWEELESPLYEWVLRYETDLSISGQMICRTAEYLQGYTLRVGTRFLINLCASSATSTRIAAGGSIA
ncbi:hypothetical protein E4U14_000993 [Claviceps sp. LM454 group G7]|nr:hypothetical protein E4U14_000993 [Claviceps sp. LM454 group G7]